MAIYWPTPDFKGRTFQLCVLTRWDFNFCVRSSPLRGLGERFFSFIGPTVLNSLLVHCTYPLYFRFVLPVCLCPRVHCPFYSVLVSNSVFMSLSTVFHSINSLDNCPFFSLCSSDLISALLVLSMIFLFMKVSFSPDITIPSGWLSSNHQLTN